MKKSTEESKKPHIYSIYQDIINKNRRLSCVFKKGLNHALTYKKQILMFIKLENHYVLFSSENNFVRPLLAFMQYSGQYRVLDARAFKNLSRGTEIDSYSIRNKESFFEARESELAKMFSQTAHRNKKIKIANGLISPSRVREYRNKHFLSSLDHFLERKRNLHFEGQRSSFNRNRTEKNESESEENLIGFSKRHFTGRTINKKDMCKDCSDFYMQDLKNYKLTVLNKIMKKHFGFEGFTEDC